MKQNSGISTLVINSGLLSPIPLNNHDTLRGANLCAHEILRLNRINLSNNAIMCILFAFAFVLGALANSTRFLVNLFLKLIHNGQYIDFVNILTNKGE